MALRKKVITVLLVVLAALTMLLYGLARMSILEQFDTAEREQVKRDVNLVVNALERTCQRLVQQTNDYAWWDSMYEAVARQQINTQFLEENFTGTAASVDADFVIIYNLQRIPIVQHAITQSAQFYGAPVPFQQPTQLLLNKIVETFANSNLTSNQSKPTLAGLAVIEGTPLLVSLSPILQSDGSGASQATFVLVKFVDFTVLPQIRRDIQLMVRWRAVSAEDQGRLHPLRCDGTQARIDPQSISIGYTSDNSVIGSIALKNIADQPAVTLYTHGERTIYAQGQHSLDYMIFGALIVGLFTSILGYMFFENLVIKPVERIDQSVQAITSSNRLGQRLSQDGVGEFEGLVGNINNMLASQERSQRALSESEARFRSMVENAPEAIVVTDNANDRCVEVNPMALQLFGYTERAEMLKLSMYDLLSLTQANGLTAREFVKREEEKLWHTGSLTCEVVIRRSDHKEVPCEARLVVLPGAEPSLMRASLTDISERKAIEARALQTQKLESLGLLAGGIAHDFNNLLTGILGQSSLALRKLPADSNVRGNIEKAIASAQHAATITRQLLNYAGRGIARHEQFDLNKLVADTANLLESVISKRIQLQINLHPDLPLMEGDPGQVQQVVMNIGTNAVQAILEEQDGTVYLTTKVVTLAQDHTHTFMGNQQLVPGIYLCLEIADTGIGMDRATLDRIFDPFFTKKRTGTGLGLSATLGIVGTHHGGLQVQSQPGYGTVFKVYFPAVEHKQVAPVEVTAPSTPITRARILVIDDQPSVRETVRDILESSGMQVLEAENGQTGLQLFQSHSQEIDAVMLDMRMPVMNGIETLTALRALRPTLKAILSSGFNDVELSQTLLQQDNVAFLPKPYQSTALVETLQKLLN